MDLASRTLLMDRELVLLTSPKNADLYLQDCHFKEVYTSTKHVRFAALHRPFDLVICDAYSPRVIYKKMQAAPWVDFVGIYEFLNGFEVHRTHFAFARMMELLSLRHISEPIRPTISVPKKLNKSAPVDVCVAVGGEWSFRTYEHWLPIVRWLVNRGFSVTLVGSKNGIKAAEFILGAIQSVKSTVGQLSLPEAVAQIASCKVFIGADGGLWHIACAIPLPTVVLFADCQIFDEEGARVTRETADMVCESLYDDEAVSNISCRSVIEACERLFARIDI